MDGFGQNDKNLKLDLLKTQENDLIKARSQDVLLQFCLYESYGTLFWIPGKRAECETYEQLSSSTVAATDNYFYCFAYTSRSARFPK